MASSNQNSATIFSLQSYITQLTCYINENNAKYTKNLETLKTFYESQIEQIQQKNILLQEQNLRLRNDLLISKDILNNREKQLTDLKYKFQYNKDQSESLREKLNNERKKIDQLYDEIEAAKKNFKQDLDQQERLVRDIQNQKNDLLFKLKEKEQDIARLSKDIENLQDQVSERYSLPQKLKDIEVESAKNKTLVQSLSQTKKQLETKLDFQSNQLEKLRKQNKRLQIGYESRDANAKKEINQVIMKQRQSAQQKQKKLQSINEKQIFQINELQNTLKTLKKQNSELQKKLIQYTEQCKLLQERIQNHNTEKDKYIEEFQKLKLQYEEVIKNLQEAIPKYQKKNWDLEQENRDLNVQLDGLRDLLNEIKAMNSLQPLKHEYRQIAELQLLAQKDYKIYKSEQTNKIELNHKIQPLKDSFKNNTEIYEQNSELKWDQLLADIDKIQVS